MEYAKLFGLMLVLVLLVGVVADFGLAANQEADVASAERVDAVSIAKVDGPLTITVRDDNGETEISSAGAVGGGVANRKKIRVTSVDSAQAVEVETELEVRTNVQGADTRLEVRTSDGFKEIKVMPDTASASAIDALRINACVPGECEIVLKDTGHRDDSAVDGVVEVNELSGDVVYEAQVRKKIRYFGIFPGDRLVTARINADSGVVEVDNPWYVYLVDERI